jgi:hypothetical protein
MGITLTIHNRNLFATPIEKINPPHENDEYSASINRETYERIHSQITQKYKEFNPTTEVGAQGTKGLLANIADISKKDLIRTMKHILGNNALLHQCRNNSRAARLFDKFYLLKGEQGWNLRLHVQYAQGNGLGGEDPPHYHRWTLASKVLTGGYCNRNYREATAEGAPPLHVYDKYQLEATNQQTSDTHRIARRLGKASMLPIKAEVFSRDSLNHFPHQDPHSVQSLPAYFGSTMTLAHSGAPKTPYSTAFLKQQQAQGAEPTFTELPEIKASKDPEFFEKFERAIAFLQILDLQDQLRTHFENAWERGKKLTAHEYRHQYDSYEPNYVETSLLSAIQIYLLEKEHQLPHREFSAETARLLDKTLRQINPKALQQLIMLNQQNLERRIFSVKAYADNQALMKQLDMEFIDKLSKHQQ